MLGLQSQNTPTTRLPHSADPPKAADLHKALKNFAHDHGVTEFGNEESARYFHAAKLLMQHQEFYPAQKLLRQVLSVSPHSSATVYALAECAGHLGQKAERLQLLKALITLDDHPHYLLTLAQTFYEQGSDQEALKYYLQAVHLLPEDAGSLFEAYKNIGNIYVRCHDFESAEENYNRAHTLNPRSATLLVNFGTLAIQRNDWDGAIQRFREAIAVDASFDRAWVGLSLVHRQFGDFDLSWANLARALDLNPLNTTALQLALSWVVKDQRWALVSESLKQYMVLNDQDAVMSLALAQLWFLQGHFASARLELTRTLALDPAIQGGLDLLNLIEQEEMKRSHGWDEHGAEFGENHSQER
ncbi:MAG: tetratricopeptide repeat protein [Bdellovibrionales bacterium]